MDRSTVLGGGTAASGAAAGLSPSFSLPMRHMLLGLAGFAVFAADLLAQSLHLAEGSLLGPSGVALTHLLTLGSLLSFTMGAVYQLSSVAFLIPIAPERTARLNFWVYAVAVGGLIASMATWWKPGLVLFGTLATLTVGAYAGIVTASLKRARTRDAMYRFVRSAHGYLPLAVAAAWLLIVAPYVPWLRDMTRELLITHIVLAAGGFFTLLIMGFSFKLLPMFTLSHGFLNHGRDWTLGLAHAAVWLVIGGAWGHSLWIMGAGAGAALAAFALHLFHLGEILRTRLRKELEPPIRAAAGAAGAGLTGAGLVMVQLGGGRFSGWAGLVAFYLLGWITFTVMGYAYKIVPFLIWTRRYSKRAGKETVPLIGDLIAPDQARPVLAAFAAGLVIFSLGIAGAWRGMTIGGAVLLASALAAFCIQLFGVVDLGKIGKEMRVDD
ncbi:MAG: hypothetical protein QJR01_01450 [Kyrpidia sp.]|nr:hypothetical protein [Kyrpidia sp.]